MSDDITPAEAPAAEDAQEKPAERTYTDAEHKAAVEAAIKARFKDVPTKEQLAELAAAKAELDRLKAEQMTEVERAKAEADAAKSELEAAKNAQKAAETRAMRIKVGAEKGVPAPLIDRLAGDDEESIAKDADAILASLPKPSVPGSNPPDEASDPADKDPFLKGFWGR